ncbi:PPSD-like protein [Mya arenaria]|uniref:PPSD-like protein n=1 Tax=Mya arenaria TaxID=6604 RepID=A0ABY7EJK2_MYAAR|nr:PPSD-like protein [Mya arenaria]
MADAEVAIVGIGCRFPGADNVDEFWKVLKNGENHVIDVPLTRWDHSKFYDPDPDAPGKTYVRQAGFVLNAESWDPEFFGISETEAALVDPQQRMVLTCTHMALEDGGITRKELAESQTGVYIAGPALTIETACSSSMVAVDTAIMALKMARMVSPSSQCRTFTKYADGYARGEGCGIVVLKRLKDALRDGNKIRATIKSGVNQDGHNVTPISAPSSKAQIELIESMYRRYGIDKDSIQVIEAHGTGTPIGDPTETFALGTVLGEHRQKTTYIGSVKTNLGHLESAAGVAGIIKTLLMMEHEIIVPSLWYRKENENPRLNLEKYAFAVPVQCLDWPRGVSNKRIACVNSFGFGGTNSHVVLEQYERKDEQSSGSENSLPFIFVLSGLDLDTLKANIKNFQTRLSGNSYDLANLSYTTIFKRDLWGERIAVTASSQADLQHALLEKLETVENRKPNQDLNGRNLVFVFCGVGTVWKGMGKDLLRVQCFRNNVEQIDKQINQLTGWSIAKKIKEQSPDILNDPMVGHIAIFTYQVALAELWKFYGVVPNSVVGISVGEVAAAYVAGELDLESATKVIYHRSRILAEANEGSMAVVMNVPIEEIEDCLASHDSLSIAVFLSPISCTVSGEIHDIDWLKAILREKYENVKIIRLDVQCGYHSKFVHKASQELGKVYIDLKRKDRGVPLISTVTGNKIKEGQMSTVGYWCENIRNPVMFTEAIRNAADVEHTAIYLEIGPGSALNAHVNDIFQGKPMINVVSVKPQKEGQTISKAICTLAESKMDLRWDHITPSSQMPSTAIPVYQLKQDKTLFQGHIMLEKVHGISNTSAQSSFITEIESSKFGAQFKAHVDASNAPYIFEHFVKGKNILPGAFYTEIALKVGTTLLDSNETHIDMSLEFLKPVDLTHSKTFVFVVSTRQQNSGIRFTVKLGDVVFCRGWVYKHALAVESSHVDCATLKASLVTGDKIAYKTKTQIYEDLRTAGFEYGPSFQLLQGMLTNGKEAVCEVDASRSVIDACHNKSLNVHPTLIDAMMQTTFMENKMIHRKHVSFVPAGMEKINVYKNPSRKMTVYTKKTNETNLDSGHQLHFSMRMFDSSGCLVASVDNFTTYSRINDSMAPCELKYTLEWLFEGRKSHQNMIDSLKQIQSNKEKRVMFVGPNWNDELNAVPYMDEIVVLENEIGDSVNEYAHKITGSNRFTEAGIEIRAIVYFVGGHTLKSINGVENVENICSYVKGNVMLLNDLVLRSDTLEYRLPIYVVTENSQSTFQKYDTETSLVGNELWGSVRSLNAEFTHGQITMIDLQPSLQETCQKLVHFINQETEDKNAVFGNQVVIGREGVYFAHLLRNPTFIPTPMYANATHTTHTSEQEQALMKNTNDGEEEFYLTDTSTSKLDITNGMRLPSTRIIQVQKAVVLPSNIVNTFHYNDSKPNLSEENCEVIGVEFVGSIVERKQQRKNEHVQNVVCVHLTKTKTFLSVNKDFVFKLKEISDYYPGLLSFLIICFRIAKSVKAYFSVTVLWENPNEREFEILRHVLMYVHPIEVSLNGSSADVVVVVQYQSETKLFTMLPRCKKIVALFKDLPVTTKRCLNLSSKIEVISITDVFGNNAIPAHLRKVSRWLKRNKRLKVLHSLAENNEHVGTSILPMQTIDIANRNNSYLPTRNPLYSLLKKDGMYIVTGGLTGLGWETMKMLAELGAGYLVSVSRRPASVELRKEIQTLERKFDCTIMCLSGDVCDFKSMDAIFLQLGKIGDSDTSLKGIFHLAGIVDSQILSNMDETHLDRVLMPKVKGTLNLHLLSANTDLDYFVVSSSIASFFGFPGQSNYGAANCFMDAFISWRRSKGLPGQSINWGALYIGMSAQKKVKETFETRGIRLLQELEVKSCFKDALLHNISNVVYADMNWDFASTFLKSNAAAVWNIQFLDIVIDEFATPTGTQFNQIVFDLEALLASDRLAQISALKEVILHCGREVFGVHRHSLNMSVTFHEVGMDSFESMTLTNVLQTITGCRIPLSLLADGSKTLSDVVNYLHFELFVEST